MTARCTEATDQDGGLRVLFLCPGCGDNHQVQVAEGWHGWNGDVESPTIQGSVQVRGNVRGRVDGVCHCFVTDGRIQFLGDCTHELTGQTVDLPPWPYATPAETQGGAR